MLYDIERADQIVRNRNPYDIILKVHISLSMQTVSREVSVSNIGISIRYSVRVTAHQSLIDCIIVIISPLSLSLSLSPVSDDLRADSVLI
jgi:hypothetical protein